MESLYIHSLSGSPEKDSDFIRDKNTSESQYFTHNRYNKPPSQLSLQNQEKKRGQDVNTSLDIEIEIDKRREFESPDSKLFFDSSKSQSRIYFPANTQRKEIIGMEIKIGHEGSSHREFVYQNRRSSIEEKIDHDLDNEAMGNQFNKHEKDIEAEIRVNYKDTNGLPSITSLDGLLEHNNEDYVQNHNIIVNNNTTNTQNNTNGRQGNNDHPNQIGQSNGNRVIPVNDNGSENEPVPNLEEIVRTEIAIQNSYLSKMRRLIGMFLGIIFATFFVPRITIDDPSPRVLFIIIYVTLSYYFLERFTRAFFYQPHPWQKTEQLFKALDTLSLLILFILLDFNVFSGFKVTKLAIIAPSVFLFLYYFVSYAPQTLRESEIAFRLLFTVQILFVTLKLDGDVNWSWKVILTLVWFYLGMICLYFILLFIIFIIMVAFTIIGRRVYDNLDRKTQLVGHIWHFLYVSFAVISLITLIGITITLEDNESYDFLYKCINTARYLSIFLISHGIVFYRHIVEYLRRINNEEELDIDYGNPENEKRIAMIKIEKKISHLVKISSTYFLPLQDSFAVKDKDHLKRLKKCILESKEQRFRREYSRKRTENQREYINNKSTFLEVLKQDREILEKKLSNFERQLPYKIELSKKKNWDNSNVHSHHNASFQPTKREDGNITELSAVVRNGRVVCLSEGDQENFYVENIENNEDNENKVCYICVEKPCNAVVMNCGHGGVCYDCALEFVKKKNQCMQCRQEVNQVIKINPDPKFTNIIQGYETVNLIYE